MHFGGRAWWTGWWTWCRGKGRTRQWSLGLWPEQLGRCEATGPDEENQERNQYHRDSFILYLIYFPQQHSSFAIFIPTLRKRKLRLSEMKLLVQAHRGLGGNRRERFFFFFIWEAIKYSVGACGLKSNGWGLKTASARVRPWASLLTSFVFICKVGIRVVPTPMGLTYVMSFKGGWYKK